MSERSIIDEEIIGEWLHKMAPLVFIGFGQKLSGLAAEGEWEEAREQLERAEEIINYIESHYEDVDSSGGE